MAKTSGIDDLVQTLIKQHGIHESIRRAHDKLGHKLDEKQRDIWLCTLYELRKIRNLTY